MKSLLLFLIILSCTRSLAFAGQVADTAIKTEFLGTGATGQFDSRTIAGADAIKRLEEVPGISTNNTAQWCLNAIQLLHLVGDKMPETHELWNSK